MITQEMLAADAALNGLTEEQQQAILLMSRNDEEVVIGNRFREVYNQMDATIAQATGVKRDGDEKTYKYLERAASILAEKANNVDGLQQQIETLTKERDTLQKAVEKGGDAELKRQLTQANADLTSVRQQYDKLKGDYDKLESGHAAELLSMQIDNALQGAKAGLKFKAEFPQAATDTLLAQALNTVKGMSPEFIDDGNGGKRLVFKGQNGEIVRNPENHLEPYTAEELLKKELRTMGILDEGRQQQGGGTHKPQEHQQQGAALDVSAARTQAEADDIIHNQLNAKGLVRGSKEYQEAYTQAWKDNNINKLPVR